MLKNQLLQQAQGKIDEVVTDRDKYTKLVQAGSKIIYDQKTFSQLSEGIAESETPVEDVAKGLVAVLNMMAGKARGTIPHDVLLQAGMTLLLDALDFMEQAGLIQVDNEVLVTATQEFIEALLPTVGLTADKMSQVLEGIKATMGNPERMAAYQKQAQGATP